MVKVKIIQNENLPMKSLRPGEYGVIIEDCQDKDTIVVGLKDGRYAGINSGGEIWAATCSLEVRRLKNCVLKIYIEGE